MILNFRNKVFIWLIIPILLFSCTKTDKKVDLTPIKSILPRVDSIKVYEFDGYNELFVYETEFRIDSNMYINKSRFLSYKYFDLFGDKDSIMIKYISSLPDTFSYSISQLEMKEYQSRLINNPLYCKLVEYTISVFDEQDYYNIRNGAYWMNRIDSRFKSADFFYYLWLVSDSSSYTPEEIYDNKRKIRAIFLLAHSSGYECMWPSCDKVEKDKEFLKRYNRLAGFYGGDLMMETDSMQFDNGKIIY